MTETTPPARPPRGSSRSSPAPTVDILVTSGERPAARRPTTTG